MKFKILALLFLCLVLAGSIYYKNGLLNLYDNFGKSIESFEKNNLGNVIDQFAKEIFTPPPLNIGGQENQAILVKEKIIAQTNIQRYNNELMIPLIENAKLNAVAKAKAEDIFEKQYFDHISPSGIGPADLVKSFGYEYIVTGENLILGNFASEKEAVWHWMDSPGHRANILNKRFTDIGVAFIKGSYRGQKVWIGVQEFGLPLSSCNQPDASLKNSIEDNKSKLDQMFLQIEVKKDQIENTDKNSPEYNQLLNEYNALVSQYNLLNPETQKIISQYNIQVSAFNNCVNANK